MGCTKGGRGGGGKKIWAQALAILALLTASFGAFAQRAIIAGEQAAGTYINVAVDANGYLRTSPATSPLIASHNVNNSIIASAARTSTFTTTGTSSNVGYNSAVFFLNITAVPGVDTITFEVLNWDPVSSGYYQICSTAAISAAGMHILHVGPGVPNGSTAALDGATNYFCGAVMSDSMKFKVVHSGAGSFTYSMGSVWR